MKKYIWQRLSFIASMLLISSSTWAQLGSTTTDLVYTPVKPCRIIDTRNPGVDAGILVAGSTRPFMAWGNNYAFQGGSEVNCNVQRGDTAAIVVNFTVVSPSTGGYITAFPGDAVQPLAATLNFNAGDVKGSSATLKLNQTNSSGDFKMYTTSQTHLVADIVGYYAKPNATMLDCYKTGNSVGSINVANSGRYLGTATAPACAAGYSSAGTNCVASSVLVNLTGIDGAKCDANHSTNTSTITANQRCCRVMGR